MGDRCNHQSYSTLLRAEVKKKKKKKASKIKTEALNVICKYILSP